VEVSQDENVQKVKTQKVVSGDANVAALERNGHHLIIRADCLDA